MIEQDGASLHPLCSHSFPLERATDAVRTLGRERLESGDAVHVTLTI
jgi:hypothetical protein